MTDLEAAARTRLLDQLHARARALDPGPLRARVRAAGQESAGALVGVTEADARRTPAAGEWSIAQVVDHVAQSTVRGAEELRHLLAGRRPPGPPVYEALLSGAAHRVPWDELVQGLHEACAALDAVLEAAPGEPAADEPAAVARVVLVLPPAADGSAAEAPFAAELGWRAYAFVLRLHFIDHRGQVRRLRAALHDAPAG